MVDGFDIVAVRVQDESGVITGVVGTLPRCTIESARELRRLFGLS
jgi:hypothetical protein